MVAKENRKSVRFAVKPQTFPPCQRLPPRGSWQSRQALTEGVKPLSAPPTGCIQTDISICYILWQGLIYQPGKIRTFFALLIYQFRLGSYSMEGRENGRRRERRGDGRAQKITGGTVNVTGIIEIFAVLPLLHPRFLCKSLKYTSCTVFQRKFIHFGKGVESLSKTRAIFVRFYPVSL